MPHLRSATALAIITSLVMVSGCSSATPVHTASSPLPRAAMPDVDDDVVRARHAVADLLRAMNTRDMPELGARYAIRVRSNELGAMARFFDPSTGPGELHVSLMDDPTVNGESAHPDILFEVELRWVTPAGQSRSQRVGMQVRALRENGLFLIASVRPAASFGW